MKLKYYTKEVYGNTLYYLVTKGTDAQEDEGLPAICLLALLGSKTITPRQMELCEQLGIVFERVFAPEEESNKFRNWIGSAKA